MNMGTRGCNMENKVDYLSWKEISKRLSAELVICPCQRKLKSIVSVLVQIYNKIIAKSQDWTPEEYLIIALLDAHYTNLITHGANIEYPMLYNTKDPFWKWLVEIKDSPDLIDN